MHFRSSQRHPLKIYLFSSRCEVLLDTNDVSVFMVPDCKMILTEIEIRLLTTQDHVLSPSPETALYIPYVS